MNQMNECILCKKEGRKEVLNSLPMFRCIDCNLVWRQEFDVPISHYADKKVDFLHKKLKSRLDNSLNRIELLKKYISLNNLCDIGCGEGAFLQALNEEKYENIIGIEPSEKEYFHAKKNNLTVYKGTIEDSSQILSDKNIQVISMFHLIEHLHNPLKSIQTLYDILPAGGFLIIETPDVDCYSFKSSMYKHKLIYKEHLFYFSKKSLEILLEKVGFKIKAQGRRDFDIHNMPIRALLMRLGFKKPMSTENDVLKNEQATMESNEFKKTNYLKSFFRLAISHTVVLLNRTDYLWVIAEKR